MQFTPQDMKLWLRKIPSLNEHNDKKNEKENIIYLAADKRDQFILFKEGKITDLDPLEDIEEDIPYNDSLLNKEFLANDNFNKEFQLDDRQLFLIFNLTTKENYLKNKMLEQLNYYNDYFLKKNNIKNKDEIESTILFINNNQSIIQKCDKYYSCLQCIFAEDEKFLLQNQNKLEKWKNIRVPHNILQDYNFRKAVYLVFDRQQIIQDIFPFYKPSCHPVSELSEFSYVKNHDMFRNILGFLDLKEHDLINKSNLIKLSFNEIKAKIFFDQAWSKLSSEQQQPIKLKTKYCLNDKRFEMIFNYFKKRIEIVFDNKIILEPYLTQNTSAEIMEKNKQGDNISSIIEDIDVDSDLCIDCYPTSDFINIMLVLLTKFYCNYTFNIDFSEELTTFSDEEQKVLKSDFQYASKKFSGINEQNKLEGDVYLINAFFLNKVKNNSLKNDINQKIKLKLLSLLEAKYFEILPAIPFFSLQKAIISKK